MTEEITRTESHPRETYQDDAQLADYLIVGWRYRWLILVLTVAGGIFGWVVSRTTPPSYEAAVVVSLAPIPADQPGATSIAAVTTLLRSPALITKVVRDLGFDKAPHDVSVSDLVTGAVTVEAIPNTTTWRVLVRLDDPERAAKVANELVRQAVAANLVTTLSQSAAERDRIRPELQNAQAHLDTLEAHLSELQASSHVRAWRAEVDELADERMELQTIPLTIAAQKAKVAAMEQELKQQSAVNPIYERLAYQLAVDRSEVAVLLERQRQLVDRTRDSSANHRLSALYAKEAEVNLAQAVRNAALQKYVNLREQYQQAEARADDKTPQLQIVEPALPPPPVSPGSLRRVVIGLVMGGFAAVLLALTLNYFKALSERVTAS
jgi:uncharacterized protein involved in exopolysaccharide biosynthesis